MKGRTVRNEFGDLLWSHMTAEDWEKVPAPQRRKLETILRLVAKRVAEPNPEENKHAAQRYDDDTITAIIEVADEARRAVDVPANNSRAKILRAAVKRVEDLFNKRLDPHDHELVDTIELGTDHG